ncbi:hypothetical protein BGZ81_006822 [Podila clonocystis]|nr:hypothetical protein BGZ81_006822 [Podila clonocystis]
MDRWDPIQLTSTFRPQLESYETIQITQDQVGLYDGRLKAEDYPNGTVYLTSERLLYIDAKNPARKSIGLPLRLISGIHSYGGFMSSSPKITLELYPRGGISDPQSSSDLIASQDNTSAGLDASLISLSLKSEPSWVCSICYHSNQGGVMKCAVCGVKKPAGSDTPTTPAADPFLLNEPLYRNGVSSNSHSQTSLNAAAGFVDAASSDPGYGGGGGGGGEDHPGIACPACTFHNDPFMIQCEICGTQLQDAQSVAFMLHRQQQHQRSISQLPSTIAPSGSTPTAANEGSSQFKDSSSTTSTAGKGIVSSITNLVYTRNSPSRDSFKTPTEDTNSVKLSFRAGGNGNFHSALKTAMATRAWESKPKLEVAKKPVPSSVDSPTTPTLKLGGVSAVMRKVETNRIETDQVLSQAFQDLHGLMDKAAEMVALAETISNRLAKSNTMDNEQTATFKTYLLSMGIAAPVTKDTAGAVFHKELARELVEFILPIVEREGGTMSLMDVYCVFNRARGVELISPKDLHTACALFLDLNLPLRLRKFDSGLLVIQTMARYSDDEVSETISARIRRLPPGAGLSALELASAIQISVALAHEQLLMTEARGLICRDESVEGLKFFDNLFAKWEI